MRTRTALLIALLSAPVVLSAQVLPRVGRRPTPVPAPLPPTAGPVARVLELHRSRWSTEGYSMFSAVRVPAGNGTSSYAMFGAGTHGGYRFLDQVTGTFDFSSSYPGSSTNMQTAEVGSRFMPMPSDEVIRPFFDVRASYIWLNDTFEAPFSSNATSNYSQMSRYGRGLGGILGAGFEYSLTNSFALSSEVSAVRGHMTAYHFAGQGTVPSGNSYTMTQYRLTLGLKYSATRVAHLASTPH